MKTSVFVINLEKRKDRLEHIKQQFLNKEEFSLKIVQAIEDTIPSYGLYKTLISIITKGKQERLPYLLICEDDHHFTNHYTSERFESLVKYFNKQNADVFLGGVSWFDNAVKSGDGHSWIDKFSGCQFMLIYSKFYDVILNTPFSECDTIDHWISRLSDMIFVAVPMISMQRDFGYSDATNGFNRKGKVAELFASTSKRWEALSSIREHVEKRRRKIGDIFDFKNLKIPTYIINPNDRTLMEFSDKEEFTIAPIETFKKGSVALDIWSSIQKIVKIALHKDEDIILICLGTHVFSKSYSSKRVFNAIFQGAFLGADLLLGMISGFRQAVVVDENLCWIDSFKSTKLLLLYKHFFSVILDSELRDTEEDIYGKLSCLTANKYVIHPFIAKEKDFDCSIIRQKGLVESKYAPLCIEYNSRKLNAIRRREKRFGNLV